MGILEGKNILVTGVTMNTSIAYRVTELAQAEGAKVVVSNLGRAVSLTRRVVGRLATVPPVLELDVTSPEHLAALPRRHRSLHRVRQPGPGPRRRIPRHLMGGRRDLPQHLDLLLRLAGRGVPRTIAPWILRGRAHL